MKALLVGACLLGLMSCSEPAPIPNPPPPRWPEVYGVPSAVDEDSAPGAVLYRLTAQHTLLRVLGSESPELSMMSYNGGVPGPTLHARVGDKVTVEFTNELDQPTTVHWHGMRVPELMDGNPRIVDPVPPGGRYTYTFVAPDAGTYWYHPHVRTNEQLERGLYGAFVVHEPDDPQPDREQLVLLDDLKLEGDDFAPFLHPDDRQEAILGRLGNIVLVNGRVAPLRLEGSRGEVVRLRVIAASNARTFALEAEGATVRIIGADSGLFAATEARPLERLNLPPGARAELEVRLDQVGAATLKAWVVSFDDRGNVDEAFVPLVTFDVAASEASQRVMVLPASVAQPAASVDREVTFEFSPFAGPNGETMWAINGQRMPMEPLFAFQQGERVRFLLKNTEQPGHPFHMHGNFFQIEDDGRAWTNQPGRRDTVLIPSRSQLSVIADLSNPGRWMVHCHILEHAELGMMAEILVEPGE
jgi:FtsP/CotA-like multicopper oxidase with cupredoxin domain